jgi:hypothetical protein
MSYNGSGTFNVYTPGNPVVTGTTISSTWANNTLSDLATGLSTAITKDGQTTVTANIPFAGYKLTGVGAATDRTDAATLANIQDGTGVYVATVGGTADAITLTPSPAIAAYAVGQRFVFVPGAANTGAATVNVSGLGAGALQKGGVALGAGAIANGSPIEVLVTAATPVFEIVGTGSYVGSGSITTSGLTMSTDRILGRTTASTGAVEEITVGSGLSLSGGSLSASAVTGNNLVLIQSQTASNAATVDFTTGIDSTYDTYLLTMADVVPQTDATDLYMRVSVDGGANYLAGTTYAYENVGANSGSISGTSSAGTTQLLVSNSLGTGTGEVLNGNLWLQNLANATVYKTIHGTHAYLNSGASVTSRVVGCIARTTSAINALRVLMSSGNINGTFNLYGVKKT